MKTSLCAVGSRLAIALSLLAYHAPAFGATVHISSGGTIDFGRRMVGATPTATITVMKDGSGTQAYTTAISNNGITAPGGSINGNSGATGTTTVTLVNNANGSGATGLKTYTVDVSPKTSGQNGRSNVSATILAKRQLTLGDSTPIDFGDLLKGAKVSSQFSITTSGDDNNRTRVNLASTAAANAHGISIASGSGTLFNSASDTGTRTLTGTFNAFGDLTGSVGLSITTAESFGVGDTVAYAPLTVSYLVSVGNATADKSDSASAFGAALSAQVAHNASYANLESRVFSTTGTGGSNALSSVATILDGTNSTGTDTGATMQWRTRTNGFEADNLISDVVKLGGLVNNAAANPLLSDVFVLQMKYSSSLLIGNEASLASQGKLFVESLDTTSGLWKNAVLNIIGGPSTAGTPVLSSYSAYRSGTVGSHGAKTANSFGLGDWGVDTANDLAWAVVNYTGSYAVVPEPSTWVMAACAAIGLLVAAGQRRQRGLSESS